MDSTDPSKLPYRPCVGIMVLNTDGRVWVGRRADMPGEAEGPGTWWQMPQGGIDENEDAGAAAFRELYEETGIRSVEIIAELAEELLYDLPPSLLGKAWGGKFRGQRQKWFAMRFTGEDGEINITPAEGHKAEFDRWKWTPMGDLLGSIVPFKREVYAKVVARFAHLANTR